MVLPRPFYARPAQEVARDLLGTRLVGPAGGQVRRARVVETEAYVGPHDRASHSRHGPTARNRSMFGPPGHAYVYFVYGMHHCLNVVCGDGDGQAVLLRAAEPLDGWDARLDGPALLARAFGLDRRQDGLDLTKEDGLHLEPGPRPTRIRTTARIGVAYAGPWARRRLRFVADGGRAMDAGRAIKARPAARRA